ncbi:MAG: DUF3794 domain-containing protein [Oscillospiraceae bacterium]|nr:DUF3794 domain-containing protein [Oscillospiraceae bacterium]MBQ8928745.1 DUF3794 domain-containing protein [Oscillospiraceae bacterium]
MELATTKAAVTTTRELPCPVQEQSVELDYVLPDYYPDVCTLVRAFITPVIESRSIQPGRLTYGLAACIRILYCTEGSHVLQSVTQTLHFTRTLELPEGEVLCELTPVTDLVNCRAVSKRRLDVRGAVTVRIRLRAQEHTEVLQDASGEGLQLRRCQVDCPVSRTECEQSIHLSEELSLGSTKPALLHVVRMAAQCVGLQKRQVSGRLMVQGELDVQLVYACAGTDGTLEPMSFRLPFSQLVESEELTEDDPCRIRCSVVSCELTPAADGSGDVHALRCEAELRAVCTVQRRECLRLVQDAYSTLHPCHAESVTLCTQGAPEPFTGLLSCDANLTSDFVLDCVYDAWCEVRGLGTAPAQEGLCITGMLHYCVLVREEGGAPRLLEREEAFEYPCTSDADTALYDLTAQTESCSYTLTGAGEVSVRTQLHFEGELCRTVTTQVLSGLSMEEALLPQDYALRLCFGRAGEEVWEIAKRCHTSVEAVMEENDLADEVLPEDGMLLIPIIG